MRNLTAILALMLAVAAAPPTVRAAQLRLYNIDVNWDPNGNLWHLTDKLCNHSEADSGTLLYEFQLYQGDVRSSQPIRIGGFKSRPLAPHKCREHHGFPVKVFTKKVPPGEYKIALWAGDWNGSSFEGGVKYVMQRTLIRSNGP